MRKADFFKNELDKKLETQKELDIILNESDLVHRIQDMITTMTPEYFNRRGYVKLGGDFWVTLDEAVKNAIPYINPLHITDYRIQQDPEYFINRISEKLKLEKHEHLVLTKYSKLCYYNEEMDKSLRMWFKRLFRK